MAALLRHNIPRAPEHEFDQATNRPLGPIVAEQSILEQVKALHRKETRYSVSGYEDHSWESMEDLADWFGEDDMPSPESITTFDVCSECARMEWIMTDFHYIGEQSAWPCSTARIWVKQ
jgi:hypothetical protein